MNAELQDRKMRPRRSIFLSILTSIAFVGASFTAPAKALESISADDSWQAAAEAASATPNELKAEVADGEIRLAVTLEDPNGLPYITSIQVSTVEELESTLSNLYRNQDFVSVQPDSKIGILGLEDVTFKPASTTTEYEQWNYSFLQMSKIVAAHPGTGATVAVIDSGVYPNEIDLNTGQLLSGCDWVISEIRDCTANGQLDENGHGTHVAGVIAASLSNASGIRGLASGVKILPLRVLDKDGSGYLSNVADAISYAIAQDVDVINLSIGGQDPDQILSPLINLAEANGIIVVAAAGNDGRSDNKVSYPAKYETVIAVAAAEKSLDYGNQGKAINEWLDIASYSTKGNYVDISAPGTAITSTFPTAFVSISGTSMAAPHVSALAALIKLKHPTYTPIQIRELIYSTATPITGETPNSTGNGFVNFVSALDCSTCLITPDPISPTLINPYTGRSIGFFQRPNLVLSASSITGVVGTPITEVTASSTSGIPSLSFSLSDSKPSWLNINATTGVISGTPTEIADSKSVVVKVRDGAGSLSEKSLTLNINAPAPAPAPAPVVVVPTIKESLNAKVVKKRTLTVSVTAPTGSKTWVQRKVGKKWRTVLRITTTPSVQVKLPRSGTYRVQIIAPTEKVTSKSFRVK